jgi:hypothetical protein
MNDTVVTRKSEKVGYFLQSLFEPTFSLFMDGASSVVIDTVYEWEHSFQMASIKALKYLQSSHVTVLFST